MGADGASRRIVAITGGTGFIGRGLVRRHLAEGDTVRVLTRRAGASADLDGAVNLFQGDLTAATATLRPFVDGADILYHCAGEIWNPRRMHAVHVDGTASLLAAAEGRIRHWVQVSTVAVYGPRASGVVTEETPLLPRGLYEETKVAADLLLMAARPRSFTCSVLRPSKVFGTEMSNNSLFQLIALIDRGLFFFIGEAGAAANYIQVSNVVDALYRCGTLPRAEGQIYLVNDGRALESFVGTIAHALGRPMPARRVPERIARWASRTVGRVPGVPFSEGRVDALISRVVYASDKIASDLGYSHAVSIEAGLQDLVNVWKDRRAGR